MRRRLPKLLLMAAVEDAGVVPEDGAVDAVEDEDEEEDEALLQIKILHKGSSSKKWTMKSRTTLGVKTTIYPTAIRPFGLNRPATKKERPTKSGIVAYPNRKMFVFVCFSVPIFIKIFILGWASIVAWRDPSKRASNVETCRSRRKIFLLYKSKHSNFFPCYYVQISEDSNASAQEAEKIETNETLRRRPGRPSKNKFEIAFKRRHSPSPTQSPEADPNQARQLNNRQPEPLSSPKADATWSSPAVKRRRGRKKKNVTSPTPADPYEFDDDVSDEVSPSHFQSSVNESNTYYQITRSEKISIEKFDANTKQLIKKIVINVRFSDVFEKNDRNFYFACIFRNLRKQKRVEIYRRRCGDK